jgi:hypothetical protein
LEKVRRFEILFLRRSLDLPSSAFPTTINPRKQHPQVPTHPRSLLSDLAPVFIYSCPTTSSIKNRMLYASSRSTVLAAAAELGITADAKIETSEVDEVTLKHITKEVHGDEPVADEKKKGFARPRGPMRRVQRTGTPAQSSGGEGESGTE